jgi:guanidinopropionase
MGHQPIDSLQTPRFAGISSFFRLPIADTAEGLDVAVFGVPFDGGQSFRSGSRFAPGEIRRVSAGVKPYNPSLGLSPYATLTIADVGDSPVNPLDSDMSRQQIADWAGAILGHRALPVAIGGDHSITLPLLRAVAAEHGGPVGLIQVDSHLDTGESYFGTRYGGGTPFRRAVEEGLIDPARWLQIGIRGPVYSEQDFDFVRDHGVRCLTMDEIYEHDRRWLLDNVAALAAEPCYITFDIDGVDPAFAPGTTAPVPGGITSTDAILLLRSLARFEDIVGFDIVEVQPAYDVGSVTSILAAHLTFEFLSSYAQTVAGRARTGALTSEA